MSISIDSSAIIAFFNKSDEHHARATQIMQEISSRAYGAPFVCDYVFDEVVNYSLAKSGKKSALQVGSWLLGCELEMLFTNKSLLLNAWELFKKSSGLSVTDCVIISSALEQQIKYVATFDGGFQQIKQLQVVS